MKKAIVFLLAISIVCAAECYSLLNLAPYDDTERHRFIDIGCEIVHVYDDGSVDFITNEFEYDLLLRSGIPFTTRINDLGLFYSNRCDGGGRNTGIFMTWDEISQWLDDLHITYPQITSVATSIGNTIEGRPQRVMKLSLNNGFWVDDPGLPNCWYDGLIHAREPVSMRNVRFFMQWLCENYERNGFCGLQATWLLENREIWCLPCNNVDGYVYNENATYGQGLWRKNRRNNGGGIYGVDLNRNWTVGWGGAGSSGSPSSSTYRGTAPLSEPEAWNVDQFWMDHPPVQMHSTHTYGNILIYPWGWTDDPTTHAEQYDTQGEIMVTWGTGELHGPSAQINYYSSGNTRDHSYGLYGSMSWNHETGASFAGFWPTDVESEKLSRRNLRSYLVTAFLAGCPLDPHVPETVIMDDIGPVSIPFTITWSAVAGPMTFGLQELSVYDIKLDDSGIGGPFVMNNWSSTTSQYHSSPNSYHSSGTGTMTWTETVEIPENGGGRLSFWSYFNIPVGSCQGSIEVSTDGEETWFYLQTFGRDDPNWRLNIHELDEWQGDTLSFRWATTGSSSDLYIDDIMVEVWEENEFIDLDIPSNSYTVTEHESGEFWYRVVTMDPDFGPSWPSDPTIAQIDLGVSGGECPVTCTILGRISPNPASGSISIPVSVDVSCAGSMALCIYDISGRQVTDLSVGISEPGEHSIYWECTGSGGGPVPSGVYFVVLRGNGIDYSSKVVIAW